MVYNFRNILFFFYFSLQVLSAQVSNPNINRIEFVGLQKTKAAYLNDILINKTNKPFEQKNISTDIQRLKNLSSIANAEYQLDTIDQQIQLTFIIDERRTALPIINFGGIKDNIWFSLGIIENNFRGYGDLLLAFYQNNDRRHSGQLYFRKPRIRNSNWGYSISLNKWSSIEPLFFDEGTVRYLYDNNGIGLTAIRNFGFNRQIEFGGTYFVEKYKQAAQQDLANPPGPSGFSINKFLTKIELKQNYLNYDFFYLKGHELSLNYQNVLNFLDASWFNSLQFQGKFFFRPRPKINIATRIKLAISTNNDSPFAPFVADSHVNIRGIGNRIDRGTAQAVLNMELRYTALHKEFWSSQLLVFSDSGTWRSPGETLESIFDSNQFRQFVGMGIRLAYQKVFGATLRVDYGIDIYNLQQRGFVIGLGQYF